MTVAPRNIVLSIALVALVVANFALERPVREVEGVASVFPGFDPARVARITIEKPTDGGTERLELTRVGGEWVLPSLRDFPALVFPIDELLRSVQGFSSADRVSTERSSHASYGVAERGTRVSFAHADGTLAAELVQGVAEEAQSGSYVRHADGDDVHRTPAFAPLDVQPIRWVDTRMLEVDPNKVRGVSGRIEAMGVSFDLLRQENGRWRNIEPERSFEPPNATVDRMLRAAGSLFLVDVTDRALAPDDGFGSPPHLYLEIDVGEESPRSVWIGAPVGRDQRYATVPRWEESWVVTLPNASYERLAQAMREVSTRR